MYLLISKLLRCILNSIFYRTQSSCSILCYSTADIHKRAFLKISQSHSCQVLSQIYNKLFNVQRCKSWNGSRAVTFCDVKVGYFLLPHYLVAQEITTRPWHFYQLCLRNWNHPPNRAPHTAPKGYLFCAQCNYIRVNRNQRFGESIEKYMSKGVSILIKWKLAIWSAY